MWHVASVEAEDFLGYEKLKLTLDPLTGITLVVGNRGAGRSNGAGKSTLFHAISYGMYGRLTKRLDPIEKVIRRGADSCRVRVTLVDAAGTVVVTRTRKRKGGAAVDTDGFDARALASGQQEAIDARFGDFALFSTTTMFAGDVSSFCRLPDGERKALLERMSNVGHYAKAADAARDDEQRLTTVIATAEGALENSRARLEDLLGSRAQHAFAAFTHAVRIKREYQTKLADVLELAEEVDGVYVKLKEARAALDAAQAAAEDVASKRAAQILDLEEQIEAHDKVIEKLAEQVSGFDARIQVERDGIARMKGDRHPDTCPTCGQRWPQDGDPDKIAAVVARHEQNILDQRRAREPAAARLSEEKEARATAKSALQALRRAADDESNQTSDVAYRRALTNAISADAQLAAEQRALAEWAAEHDVEPDDAMVDQIDDEIAKVKEKIAKAEETLAASRVDLDHAQFWKKGFGRSGLPSFLIDSSIPAMTEIANEIARDLSDGELTVRFDAAAEKGSKSVFNVEVDYANGGEGFDSASNGEALRVDMSVLFAIRDLSARRSGIECSQLFFDEVFDGADEHFANAFISMLRRRYKDRACVVISHDPAVASLCDRTITARKRRAISELVA